MPLQDLMRSLLQPAGEGGTVLSSPLASLIGLGLSVADTRFAGIYKSTVLEPEKLRLDQAQKNIKLQLELEKLRQLKELKLTGPAATAPTTKPKTGVPSKPKESPPIVSPFLTAPQTIGGFQVPSAVPQAPPQQGVQPLPSPVPAVVPTGSVQEMKNAFSKRLFNVGASVGEISLIKAGATGYFSSLAKIKNEQDKAGRQKTINAAFKFNAGAVRSGVRPSLARHSLATALSEIPGMTPEQLDKSLSAFNRTFATKIKAEDERAIILAQGPAILQGIKETEQGLEKQRQASLGAPPSSAVPSLAPSGAPGLPPPPSEIFIRKRVGATRGRIRVFDHPVDVARAKKLDVLNMEDFERTEDAKQIFNDVGALPPGTVARNLWNQGRFSMLELSERAQKEVDRTHDAVAMTQDVLELFDAKFTGISGTGLAIASTRAGEVFRNFGVDPETIRDFATYRNALDSVVAPMRLALSGTALTDSEIKRSVNHLKDSIAQLQSDPKAAAASLQKFYSILVGKGNRVFTRLNKTKFFAKENIPNLDEYLASKSDQEIGGFRKRGLITIERAKRIRRLGMGR